MSDACSVQNRRCHRTQPVDTRKVITGKNCSEDPGLVPLPSQMISVATRKLHTPSTHGVCVQMISDDDLNALLHVIILGNHKQLIILILDQTTKLGRTMAE